MHNLVRTQLYERTVGELRERSANRRRHRRRLGHRSRHCRAPRRRRARRRRARPQRRSRRAGGGEDRRVRRHCHRRTGGCVRSGLHRRGCRGRRERLGPVLVLVNNAGVDTFGSFRKVTLDEWNRTLTVNLTGTFLCCQAIVPDMIDAEWGRIVNISSSSAQGGQAYMTPYVASKAGVIGFTKALALELGPKGITVNTIPPGFIDTPMLRAAEERGVSARASSTTRASRRCGGPGARRTSRRRARSSSATRRATSRAR